MKIKQGNTCKLLRTVSGTQLGTLLALVLVIYVIISIVIAKTKQNKKTVLGRLPYQRLPTCFRE